MEAKKPKIIIDDVCEQELKEPALNEGMTRLIEFSRGLKMNPRHAWSKAFRCVYKGKKVATFNMHEDVLFITVYIADEADLERVVLAEADGHEILMEIMNRNATHCEGCNPSRIDNCGSAVKLNTTGGKYGFFCSRFNYNCKNPTPQQFKIIERLIEIRRNYIATT
jgi:hypothetical protein